MRLCSLYIRLWQMLGACTWPLDAKPSSQMTDVLHAVLFDCPGGVCVSRGWNEFSVCPSQCSRTKFSVAQSSCDQPPEAGHSWDVPPLSHHRIRNLLPVAYFDNKGSLCQRVVDIATDLGRLVVQVVNKGPGQLWGFCRACFFRNHPLFVCRALNVSMHGQRHHFRQYKPGMQA